MDTTLTTTSRLDMPQLTVTDSQHQTVKDEPAISPLPLSPMVPLSKSSTIATLNNAPCQKLERMNIRLASAFVIFFVFGWGDGGMTLLTLLIPMLMAFIQK
jgi:hypothetical protein